MKQLKKQGMSTASLIRDETKRMRNSIDMFLDTKVGNVTAALFP
jgi:hypothetical protein